MKSVLKYMTCKLYMNKIYTTKLHELKIHLRSRKRQYFRSGVQNANEGSSSFPNNCPASIYDKN